MRMLTTGKSSDLFPLKTSNSTKTTRAFTLIELTVIVFLIGLMLALSIPRFRYAVLADTLKSATRRMIGTVRSLRNTAVQDQKAYELHFDLESDRYWIQWDSITDEEEAEERQKAVRLPAGVRILDVHRRGAGKKDTGETTIYFSKKGYVEQALIHLGNEDGSVHTIVLSPFLDAIDTYDKYVDSEVF